MLQCNPHKRMLKTETTFYETDGIPFPTQTRTVIPLNEIRSSDLEFDNTQTLQIVDDVITVVPRPAPPVVVPDTVDRWKLKTVLQADGKWDNVLAVADTLPAEQKLAVINGLEGAATINRNHALVQMMIAIPALDITAEEMDEYYVATKQFD